MYLAFITLLVGFLIIPGDRGAVATTITDVSTVYVTEGGTAVFEWTYSLPAGVSLDQIRWTTERPDPGGSHTVTSIMLKRAGQDLTVASAYRGRATNPQSAFMSLTGVTADDVGTYTCNIMDSALSVVEDSASLLLAVSPAAPVISQSPPTPNTLESLTLTCTTAGGFPAASISWYRGDVDKTGEAAAQQDTQESDGNFTSTRTLTFTPVRGDDGVTYRCVISHVALSANLQDQLTLDVQYPAEITTAPPATTRLKQGESATTSCPADGNPATFSYTWKEGTRVIDPSTEDRYSESNGVLTISSSPRSLHGTTYTCEVTNNVGNTPASASTVLSVEYDPEVSAPPEETVTQGGTLTVQCTVSANPAASSVEWTEQGSSTALSSTAQLSIPNIQRTAAGTYVCTAQNTFHDGSTGTGTANTVVTVQYEPSQPTVTISPNPAVEGQTVTLTCSSASSLPPPHSYSWTRDGQPVSNSGGTLTISSVQRGQAGQYRCSATNVVGTSEESGLVELVVNYEATGTLVTPSTAAEREGDPLTLTCTADGKPDPTFTWSKDPGPIPAGIANSNLVQIPSLHRSHAGTYTCTADNGIGDSDSAISTVDVLYLDTPTLNQTSPLTVLEGDSVTILCLAVAIPSAGYKWTKLNTSDQWDSNVLTFTQVNRTDVGTYICEASNNIKGTTETEPEPDTVTLEIIVNYPPELTVSATPNPVNETYSVSLTCTADSHPDVTSMAWVFVETGETLLQQTTGNSLTYTYSSVSHEHAGVYRCAAVNGVTGSPVNKDVTLNVNFIPIFNHTTDKYAVERSQPVTLECSAFAYPTRVVYTWMKGGYDITGNATSQDGVSRLYIASVQLENYGDYTCTADNEYGRQSTVIQLVSESKPDSPTNLAYTKKTGAGVATLTWTAGSNGGLVTTHTVQYRMEGTTDWVSGPAVVEDRPEFTQDVTFSEKGQYDIRIRAENRKGSAESDVIQVLVEDNQILYGTLAITSVEYTEGVCEGELSNRIVTQLDSIFDSYKGYEGNEVISCRSGSVLADFEATVAQSEAAAAMDTYIENLSDGQLGEFTVEPGNSKISDTKPTSVSGDSTTVIIIAVVVSVVVLIAGTVAVIFLVRRHTTHDKPPANNPNSMELEEAAGNSDDGYQSLRMPKRQKSDHTYQGLVARRENEETPEGAYEDVKAPAEFPRSQLNIKEDLGQGEFGSVYKAEAWKISGSAGVTTVAVKELIGMSSPTASTAFFKELSVLKVLGTHPNVVSFLGCCTDTEPFYLLLEFVSGGSLQSTLRTSRTQQTYGNLHGGSKSLSSRDLTKFAWDVAKGMSFLSSKKILHRDLATRNVLVSADRTCKVSDFGFSREGDEYERTTKTRLPVRWMAPESLFHRKYTTKSDVWAFGVLLWEIVTLGATPYPGMSKREVMDGVQQGYRIGKPNHCDQKFYTLMLSCWSADPAQRPEFRKIQRTLDTLMETEHDYINLSTLDENTYQSLQTATDEKY